MVPATTCAPFGFCNTAEVIASAYSDVCLRGAESEEPCAGSARRKTKARQSRRKQAAFKGKLCKYFFSRRGCKKGQACEFAHGEEDLMDKSSHCVSPADRLFSISSCDSMRSSESTACSERLATASDWLSDAGLSEETDALEQMQARWPNLGTPDAAGAASGATGETSDFQTHCHYELNFGGIVAKLRTRNTFLEFEEEEEVGVRRVARATSAPASFRGSR